MAYTIGIVGSVNSFTEIASAAKTTMTIEEVDGQNVEYHIGTGGTIEKKSGTEPGADTVTNTGDTHYAKGNVKGGV